MLATDAEVLCVLCSGAICNKQPAIFSQSDRTTEACDTHRTRSTSCCRHCSLVMHGGKHERGAFLVFEFQKAAKTGSSGGTAQVHARRHVISVCVQAYLAASSFFFCSHLLHCPEHIFFATFSNTLSISLDHNSCADMFRLHPAVRRNSHAAQQHVAHTNTMFHSTNSNMRTRIRPPCKRRLMFVGFASAKRARRDVSDSANEERRRVTYEGVSDDSEEESELDMRRGGGGREVRRRTRSRGEKTGYTKMMGMGKQITIVVREKRTE